MKIEGINLHYLQNAEHYEIMNEINMLIIRFKAEKLDIEEEYPVFEAAFADEDKSYKMQQKSADTRIIKELDDKRDATLSGFQAQIRAFSSHYNKIYVGIAYRLQVLLDSYGYLQSMSYDTKTAGIINLLQDLRDRYDSDIDSLELEEWRTQLEADNNAFVEALNRRYLEQSEMDAYTLLRDARVNTDKAYIIIKEKINAGIIFFGPEKYESFVYEINVRISHFKNTIAKRRGRAAAKKEREDEDNNKQEEKNNDE